MRPHPTLPGLYARWTLLVAMTAAAITTLVLVVPQALFVYHSPVGRTVIETSAALVALLGAYLLVLRHRTDGRLRELLLAAGLTVLGLRGILFGLVGDPFGGPAPGGTSVSLAAQLFGTGLLMVGALLREHAPPRRRPALVMVVAGPVLVVLALYTSALLFGASLSLKRGPRLSATHPRMSQSPGLTAMQLAVALGLLATAWGLSRRADRDRDRFVGMLGVAAVLLAFAHCLYGLYPSRPPGSIHMGDLFRLSCYAALLAGAFGEILDFHRRLADVAMREERSRIARDLHDGLAQELAYLVASIGDAREQDRAGSPGLEALADSAERALVEARTALLALNSTDDDDEPFADTLARTVQALGRRAGVEVDVDVETEVEVAAALRPDLLKVVREAFLNAAAHGRATSVRVILTATGDISLEVRDDGCGFDSAASEPAGSFGLKGMRARAGAMGGVLTIESSPGRGTSLRLRVPLAAGR